MKPDEMDAKALGGWGGFYGEEGKSPNGIVVFYAMNQYSRAVLARAVTLPAAGAPVADSYREGPGWTEGCSYLENNNAQWHRFVEKNGRVYQFVVYAHKSAYDNVKEKVRQILDTAKVPGESSIVPPDKFVPKKGGPFDVVTDAQPEKEANVKRALDQLGNSREVLVKALGGKPFDAGKPVVWLFQNGNKFEDRVKESVGQKIDFGVFSGPDRVALVSVLQDNVQGHDEAIYEAGARHYLWQYFGGVTPYFVDVGLSQYARNFALGGGKKLELPVINNAKAAVVAGKRRLDQWLDLSSWNDVQDNNQGANELFAWHCYFREGKGAKKYKKQYSGYLQTLRDTGDPAAAKKAFDGVNFDEMLKDFKEWATEWKP
jgi:hypothetical protein